MQFVQSYEALYAQVGVLGDPALRKEDIDFDSSVRTKCGIGLSQTSNPSPTPPPSAPLGSEQCVIPAYLYQIQAWKNMLEGPAAEEAARPIQEQVAIQKRLQLLGYIPAQAQADGVFGAGTRAAIIKWQASVGHQTSGILSDSDVRALMVPLATAAPQENATPAPAAQTVEQAWQPFIPEASCMLQHGFSLQTFVQQNVSPTDALAAQAIKLCQAAQPQTSSDLSPSPPSTVGSSPEASSVPDVGSTSPPTDSTAVSSAGAIGAGQAVTEGQLQITVTSVQFPDEVGNDIFSHTASEGGTLVAIQYTFKNTSSQPADSDSQPAVHLLDTSSTSYDADDDATSDYAAEVGADQKIISDLNPGITTKGVAVFEVSKSSFDPSTWHIYFGDDQDDLFSLANAP